MNGRRFPLLAFALSLGLAVCAGGAGGTEAKISPPILYDNGPIVTHPGAGTGGADVSARQDNLGMATFGFANRAGIDRRIADDFTIPDPAGWHISEITFLAYQTNSGLASTITGLYLQIWDGRPGDHGSSVVFGDLTTNRMAGTQWSGIYRTEFNKLTATDRPVMATTATVDTHLPEGTYWLDWMTDGSIAVGPWAPPIAILGETATGNGRQFWDGSWQNAIDDGTYTQQGFPFVIRGNGSGTERSRWSYDYNGDGTSDIAIFRPASGLWAVRGVTRAYFGSGADTPVAGDFNGDGTTDIGIFRPASGLWAVRGVTRAYFGSGADIAAVADFNGDGSHDIAIVRPASGLWAVRGVTRFYFGSSTDTPIPGYYQGSGAEAAIFRPASGLWAIRGVTRVYFGSPGDDPVPGDYDGDGTWAPAVFRPASGLWAVRGVTRVYFGSAADSPRPGVYRGDGTDSVGVFRPASGLWAVRGVTRVYFGGGDDVPVTR